MLYNGTDLVTAVVRKKKARPSLGARSSFREFGQTSQAYSPLSLWPPSSGLNCPAAYCTSGSFRPCPCDKHCQDLAMGTMYHPVWLHHPIPERTTSFERDSSHDSVSLGGLSFESGDFVNPRERGNKGNMESAFNSRYVVPKTDGG